MAYQPVATGYGYAAIIVAYLGGLNPIGLPSQLLSSLPYIVTILMLTVISSRGLKSRV